LGATVAGAIAVVALAIHHTPLKSEAPVNRKRATLVDWADLVSVGPDAVIVADESAVRDAMTDSQEAAADGTLDVLGKLALGNNGNALGTVSEVEFNEETGALQTIMVGEEAVPPPRLLGLGSYAAVLAVPAA
jgi:sporulation protein YlmC with PRC-barrel domain